MFRLQLGMIIQTLILITFFLLSNTKKYMFQSYLYQQKTIKNYQNFLKLQFIRMNIKQKLRIKIGEMSIYTQWIVCFSLYKSRC